jgi:hypothetical protein
MIELERMRQEMDEMERERSQMIAEVEAQIERALVSMAFSDNMSDAGISEGGTSRPGSALSSHASSRPSSRTGGASYNTHLRSFGTATTLAPDDQLVESHPFGDESGPSLHSPTIMTTVKEADEDVQPQPRKVEPLSENALRRWTSIKREPHNDGLTAIDVGISERSDAVAQKMLQIQQKVRNNS